MRRDPQAMRERLLDAALQSLVELGYARTTTVEVQRRSGTSRGALLHHFPTRADLMAAIVARIGAEREASMRTVLAATALEPISTRDGIALIRRMFSGPLYQAELELWSAARTEPELRKALRAVEVRLGKVLRASLPTMLGAEAAASPIADLTLELIRGMTVSSVLKRSGRDEDRLLDAWAALIDSAVS